MTPTRLLFGWLDRLPSWLRAGVSTAFFVAVPGFLLSLAGWLGDLAEWAAGDEVDFPDISAVRRAAVALVLAVILGGINAAVRWVQERTGSGNPPVYPTRRANRPLRADRGQSTRTIAIVALVLAFFVLVLIL